MALKSFWGKIRMCDNEWLSTLPLWTEPDQLMFWHPGDFNETWMGCWDRPFPKHFRTACFRCQRGMTMQFVRIPENPGASLHLSDFWTDLQLVGRRWHPKGSFSTIFQMIQWYLGIWFVFTGYIGMWGTPQVGRLYTWVWSHVGMPQDTADRLNYWDAVGWPIDAEVFGFPRVRVGSSDGRQVAVKTDNVHARCEILDLFADWMHRVEPVLLKSKAFVWMFFFFQCASDHGNRGDFKGRETVLNWRSCGHSKSQERWELLVPRIWVKQHHFFCKMSYGNFGVQPKHPGVAPSFWITGGGARVHPPTFFQLVAVRDQRCISFKLSLKLSFLYQRHLLWDLNGWWMDGWIDFFHRYLP